MACFEGQCLSSDATVDRDAARRRLPDVRTLDAGLDMMAVQPDMALSQPDMALPLPDMALPLPDMALPLPDMALPLPDMARPQPDMALPQPDMARPQPDMALPQPDMALPQPDMALPQPDMALPLDAEVLPDMAVDAGLVPDAALPQVPYGGVCFAAAQCLSGICVNDPEVLNRGMCTVGCAESVDCPGADVCLPSDNGVGVCFRNETGRPCAAPIHCPIEGICLAPPAAPFGTVQPVCVARCVDDSKCPAGFTCRATQTNMGLTRVCAPRVERLDICFGGRPDLCPPSCIAPPGGSRLDATACVNVGPNGAGDGYCSCFCNSTVECAAGFACAQGQGRLPFTGLCLPIAGYTCRGDGDQCPSLVCYGDDTGGDCTTVCLDAVDCPTGYDCDVIEGIAERLCLPVR